MHVVAFNGSARKDGNTAVLIETVFEQLQPSGVTTDMVQMAGAPVQGCIACYKCFENKDRKCAVTRDAMNDHIAKMLSADAIILGSPTYFADLSANMKALIERAGMVARANGHMFRRKVGSPVVAVRRAGATHVMNSINHFFLISQMVVPGSIYWSLAVGREPGKVREDQEGMDTMRELGKNIAWLLRHTANVRDEN